MCIRDRAATAITDLTDNPYIIALLIDLILLVLGMIMDMAPIILIATPILCLLYTSYAAKWVEQGLVPAEFLAYVQDETKITFPWSMICLLYTSRCV